jgi:SAM-dependent methyltransferase
MDPHHAAALDEDDREVNDLRQRSVIRAKLAWYGCTRPIMDAYWRRVLGKMLAEDAVFKKVNMFLNGEGGMFKKYVYHLCERPRPLNNSSVLVPGIGYAKNLLQLASFRPKEIVAFDLYEYPEAWRVMAEKIRKEFGVPVRFYKGDFDVLPRERRGSFDFVISDAVLEHVPDMDKFAAGASDFLKTGGVFYASFGPLWYGPSGDHVAWGPDKLFDHLLLPQKEYDEQLGQRSLKTVDQDSCDPGFMIRQDFFSHLKAWQYLDEIGKHGLDLFDLRAKVSPAAFRLLMSAPDLGAALDMKNVPAFDRFSGGLYIWARKKKSP